MQLTAPIPILHRLPFTDLASDGVQGIAMNPVAPTVYVHVHQQLVDPLAVALAYWPWVLTPLAALLLAFTLWRTLRIHARPQRRGVPHCRKCNYDLSGAIAKTATAPLSLAALSEGEGTGEGSQSPASPTPSTSSSLCPECGKFLTRRNIRRGRSTRRRLTPLATPLIAFTALPVALAAGWRPTLPAWPSPTAHSLALNLGITIPKQFLVGCPTIFEVDLATGATVRTVLSHVPQFVSFAVSPTGDSIIVCAGDTGPFVHYSTASGRELRRLEVRYVPQEHTYSICGFSRDSSSVYVRVSDSETSPIARVVRWSLVDGSTFEVEQVSVIPIGHAHGTNYLAWRVIPLPGEDDPMLVLHSHGSWGFSAVSLDESAAAPKAILQTPVSSFLDAAVQGDGSRVFITRSDGLYILDTRNLKELVRVSAPPFAPEAAERNLLWGYDVSVDTHGQLVGVRGDAIDEIGMYDSVLSTWVAPLAVPQRFVAAHGVEFSTDGAFSAGVGWTFAASGFRGELLIWNILPLRVAPPPAEVP